MNASWPFALILQMFFFLFKVSYLTCMKYVSWPRTHGQVWTPIKPCMDLVSSIGCGFSSHVMGLRGSELSVNQTVEYSFFFLKKKKSWFRTGVPGGKKNSSRIFLTYCNGIFLTQKFLSCWCGSTGRLPKWLNVCEMGDLELEHFPRCLFQMTSLICTAGSEDLRRRWLCHAAERKNISTMSAAGPVPDADFSPSPKRHRWHCSFKRAQWWHYTLSGH